MSTAEDRRDTATGIASMVTLPVYFVALIVSVIVAVASVGWVWGLSVGVVASFVLAGIAAAVTFGLVWMLTRFWVAALLIGILLVTCGRALWSLLS